MFGLWHIKSNGEKENVMLVVISPAKKLDMNSSYSHTPTQPVFLDHAQELAAGGARAVT